MSGDGRTYADLAEEMEVEARAPGIQASPGQHRRTYAELTSEMLAEQGTSETWIETLERDPQAIVSLLKEFATQNVSGVQMLVRLSRPGQATLVLGFEDADFKDDAP